MESDKFITLKPGREKSVLLHHPWIFSGSIATVKGEPGSGDTVLVLSSRSEPLGWAAYSPLSSIRARMWNWDVEEQIDIDFFRKKLSSAFERRKAIIPENETDAYRLVHAESDGLPGLIIDRYADNLVFQFLTAGAEAWRESLMNISIAISGCKGSVERSDVDVRQLEGLAPRSGVIEGKEQPDQVEINENGLKFKVDLLKGQKTGFYIDQRANRQRVRGLVAGRKVLNCFCYTGGFTVYALAGGASEVTSIDSSHEALELGKQNANINGFKETDEWWIEGDVFQYLRLLRDHASQFDMVILDPPKFAPTVAQAERAARGYKDINLLAMKLIKPGGLLVTFSCSGGISTDLFQKIVAGAALDAGVNARIVERLSQGPDHPVALNFPEGAYLKGLICQIN
jgi:23S rRNA (cytosine1962-C5)-methyltransferase